MNKQYRVGGYVKLAKLWQRQRDEAIELHNTYFQERCNAEPGFLLSDVFIDITGNKHVYNRQEMVRLLSVCANRQLDVIVTPSRAYLAPNTREFCYLIKYLFSLPNRIDIVSDDSDSRIDTILNVENQRQSLLDMANTYSAVTTIDYNDWMQHLMAAMNKLQGCV